MGNLELIELRLMQCQREIILWRRFLQENIDSFEPRLREFILSRETDLFKQNEVSETSSTDE